jgi:hypothetical protein
MNIKNKLNIIQEELASILIYIYHHTEDKINNEAYKRIEGVKDLISKLEENLTESNSANRMSTAKITYLDNSEDILEIFTEEGKGINGFKDIVKNMADKLFKEKYLTMFNIENKSKDGKFIAVKTIISSNVKKIEGYF